MAATGFDFVFIDGEHGNHTLASLPTTLMAFNGHATVPIVRVPWNDAVTIKSVLDDGADGVIAPMIMNAEETRALTRASFYPPDGARGFGPLRASAYYRDVCQRRLKIRPRGGAKDCHLGWWSELGERLGVGDAVRGFFGGGGQRSHAELKRSAPAGRPQGGMVYRVGVGLATRASEARCRLGPGDGVPQFSCRHRFCGRGSG